MEYVFKENDKLYMVRCPECGVENYGPAVATGKCVWCGRTATEEDVKRKDK